VLPRRRLRQPPLLQRDIVEPAVETTPHGTIENSGRAGFRLRARSRIHGRYHCARGDGRLNASSRCSAEPNYRFMWVGQIVSEIGDHFNNIAVFSLAVAATRSGMVVSGVMLSRAIPAMLIGPAGRRGAGRLNRKAGDDRERPHPRRGRARLHPGHRPVATPGLLYSLSAAIDGRLALFHRGRSAILPAIATREELHTANSLTQTTGWTTLTIGTSSPASA